MILVIIVIGLVTSFIQYGLYFDPYESTTRKKVILSFAVLISVWWIMLLIHQVYFYLRNDLGFSINYDLKNFIFDDHWFLSSLLLGSIIFLILVANEKISRIKRKKLLASETEEQRNEREEREAKEERERMIRRSKKNEQLYAMQEASRQKTPPQKQTQELKCPKCASTNLTANTKGFGLGKAAVGGVLLGPVGLLGGLVGSKKPVFICLKCGNQFEK